MLTGSGRAHEDPRQRSGAEAVLLGVGDDLLCLLLGLADLARRGGAPDSEAA